MDKGNPQLSCFLIGSDSLLIECAEILLRQGHDIRGVITSTPKIRAWAQSRHLRTLEAKSDAKGRYVEALKSAPPFDYLFAITYLSIIPDEALALPRRGAINFHDGPLPRYAGLNAPAWALMRREPTYGISWHFITAGIDTGDVLKQRMFDVAPRETSLSLNTKCFAHAIDTFSELVGELANGTARAVPQEVAARTYFGKYQRPEGGCLLDWRTGAAEIDAMVRALDFGRYPNALGAAKFRAGAEGFLVTRSDVREDGEAAAPGTIVSLEDGSIGVATSSGVLDIQEIRTLAGAALGIRDWATRLGLGVGALLECPSEEERTRWTELDAELCRAESFWVSRLARATAPTVPYAAAAAGGASRRRHHESMAVDIPTEFRDRFGGVAPLVAAFSAYMGRMAEDGGAVWLSLREQDLVAKLGALALWASPEVPLSLAFEAGESFRAHLERLEAELAEVRRRKTFLRDVGHRHPDLRGQAGHDALASLPVGVAIDAPAAEETTLTLRIEGQGATCSLVYNADVLSGPGARAIGEQLAALLRSVAAEPERAMADVSLLGAETKKVVVVDWNRTERDYPHKACVHRLFEAQVDKAPESTALVFEGEELSYRALNERANQLAAHLRQLDIGPDALVGLFVERSIDLVVAALATLKAGGAYVPLDPAYPKDRIAFMLSDARVRVVLTQDRCLDRLPPTEATIVRVDGDWDEIAQQPYENLDGGAEAHHLAYVIYTSGSTGKPKGVMVEHRNVVSFFTGMDERIAHDEPRVWLAVTSLSFDISVLELFWTLTRGFKVVVFLDRERADATNKTTPSDLLDQKPIDFSLFYFSADESENGADKYRLLLEGAKFADENGFVAVWTPERHFHAFGGLYPHPAITGAAVAAITRRVGIRAGSMVLPLHHPVRVAEAWSVVDNLSRGRVGVSVASGWQPNDFIFRPENYKDAKGAMFRDLELVKKLWRGESLSFPGPNGQVEVRILPRPVQAELPVWITTAGNIDTYKMAGAVGAHVLTHLLGQSVEKLAPKIQAYRGARAAHGFDPDAGIVSLMLHTFVGGDAEFVLQTVRAPLKSYLASSLELLKQYAWAFPAFSRPKDLGADRGDDLQHLSPEEREAMLEHAFERYYETSGLFGRPEDCLDLIRELKRIGVDEIACLIDFGVATAVTLAHLPYLDRVRQLANGKARQSPLVTDYCFAAQVRRHGVTHLQCTPSMARMLLGNDETRAALRGLKVIMIGGEAFPPELARELRAASDAALVNMYGPTETTIWSTTHQVTDAEQAIPIGRPIANTRIYILDRYRQPVPVGINGELYIGGAGVARGYLQRPELTAERFVHDPYAAEGARMYRTGDLARFRPDGVIEFLGRADHQVKVRGYRIELGEIESVLARQPVVRECVVIVREDTPGDQRLVAYLVPRTGQLDTAALREAARQVLPDFMVPAHFVVLPELPQTPNRKVDRKALPAPERLAETPATAYVAPDNELEATITKLWQQVLGRDRIGVEDNFFDVGGHSLLVVRMHRRLLELVSQPVALTDLYRFPTVRSLVSFLNSSGPSASLQQSVERADKRRELLQRRRRRDLADT